MYAVLRCHLGDRPVSLDRLQGVLGPELAAESFLVFLVATLCSLVYAWHSIFIDDLIFGGHYSLSFQLVGCFENNVAVLRLQLNRR